MRPPYYEMGTDRICESHETRLPWTYGETNNKRRRILFATRILGVMAAMIIIITILTAVPRPLVDSQGDFDEEANPPMIDPTPAPKVYAPVDEFIPPPVADSPVLHEVLPPPADSLNLDATDPSVVAQLAVDALYARQSTTLAQATARYTLRTKRAPPPNYELWYQFAQEKKCLIDDYDQIHRDFKPFYELAERNSTFFQEMIDRAARELEEAPAEICVVEVRDGAAYLEGGTSYGGVWPNTFAQFSAFLPNMKFLINGRDEPRVAFNYRVLNALEHAFLVNDSTPFNIAPTPTAEFFRGQSGCLVSKEANGFMEIVNDDHSFLIYSAKSGFTTDLYPVLSMARISPCFSDILFPTEYYYERSWWSGKFMYPDNIPWDDKKPQLYWRGMSTGGMIVGDNYHRFMRFKLADIARDHPDLMDVSLTRFAETLCEEGCDRAAVLAEYNITEQPEPREDLFKYKYAMDVDGTTFSGRFLGLLRSGSLVFKATLFEEYFNDWLRPYEHYVPIKPDLSDLVQQITWANEHPDEARLIQQRGQAIAQRVMTDDQNDCYFSAVLLEWAGLQERAAQGTE